jgi:hypothetical protein
LGCWAAGGRIDGYGNHLGWVRPETRPLTGILQRTNPFVHSASCGPRRRLGGYRLPSRQQKTMTYGCGWQR